MSFFVGFLLALFVVASGQTNEQQQVAQANQNHDDATKPASGQHHQANKPQEPSLRPLATPSRQQTSEDEYLVGVGIADITGPAADINLVSLLRQLAGAEPVAPSSPASGAPAAAAAGNNRRQQLASIDRQSSASSSAATANELLTFRYPSWREFQDVKLQFKINLNSFLLRNSPIFNVLLRWAMPSRIKMQAEYTYANLVVQL